MQSRALTLASFFLLFACQSPTGGETGETADASGTGSEGSSGDTPTTTATAGEGTGTDDGGATCEACGDDEACIAGQCVAVGRGEVERGCSVLGDPGGRGQCLYPWPSDLWTVGDAASKTGRRLAHDPELLPRNSKMMAFAADEITNTLDGFSPNSQIRFAFAAAIDPADLVAIDDIGASLAADSPIVLLEVDSGERWPFFAERDATAEAGEPVTVFIRPMKRLGFGKRYVVALRGLHDEAGQLIEPAPLFRALRDSQTTDVPQLEALRDGHAEIFAALDKAGVARADLQLAWDFHTASAQQVQGDLAAIAPQVAKIAGAGDLGYTIDQVEIQPNAKLARVIRGHFTVPSCLAGDSGPGSLMHRDADGAPLCDGTTEAPFVIAVPQPVWDAGTPVPFIVYGHGLLGTGEEAASIAERTQSVIVAGTDFWGMASEDVPTILGAFNTNFVNGNTVPDRLLQSSVNFTTLAFLAQGDLVKEAELQVDVDMVPQSLIDPTSVQYLGGSQGGIMGATVVAMAPNLPRGILVVGAGNYALMIWRSSAFSMLSDAWGSSHPDPQEREFLFALVQSAFDRADPLVFSEFIDAPLAGGEPKRLLLVESIGDSQVPNIATEVMARSYGMPMLAPGLTPVWGVEDANEPLLSGSALLQVDTGKGPLPPIENLPPPDGDNGAHGSAVDDPAMIEIVERFIFKAIAENLCDGPCDPG